MSPNNNYKIDQKTTY